MENKIFDIKWELFSDFFYNENFEPINLYYFKLYVSIYYNDIKLNTNELYNNFGLTIIDEKNNEYIQYEIISKYFLSFFDCALISLQSKVLLSKMIDLYIQNNNIIISLN